MRNTANSAYNRTVHDEDTDAEASLRAQHAALAKMAAQPEPVTGPAPTAPTPSVAPIAPQGAAPQGPMAHPAFAGIINALKRPKVANVGVKIAPALRIK